MTDFIKVQNANRIFAWKVIQIYNVNDQWRAHTDY